MVEPGVYPDLAHVDEIPPHVRGLNGGAGLERYRKAQRLRRQLIEMITPDLVAEFCEHWHLNKRIEASARARASDLHQGSSLPGAWLTKARRNPTHPPGHPIHSHWPKASGCGGS
jgi:hypothetical protein